MYINNKFLQFKSLSELEALLGDPNEHENLFSFSKFLELDEKSEFPVRQSDFLIAYGLQKHYIPNKLGGYLTSFEEMGYVFRSLYRRDISLGLGFGSTTFMAAVHILIAGSQEQKHRLSELVLNGHTISIGYHEQNHGNDLLNNESYAYRISDGSYHLTGSKWVINNVTTSKALTTFIRTEMKGGPRGFSLFFIDKDKLLVADYSYIHKIKTLGVKGCRIGGIQFNNASIDKKHIIGKIGDGFELTVKAFQITRAVLPSMAIGSGDTALRLGLQFASERNLYGNSIKNIPHVKETLTSAFINLIIADSLAAVATRSLHVIPEQMSIVSAITKFQIPKLLSANLKSLSVILGSRFYMREGTYGTFQKIVRDFPIISLGHSSDVICLHSILPQLKYLLNKTELSKQNFESINQIFTLEKNLPPFNGDALKLSNNGYNDIFNMVYKLKDLLDDILPKLTNREISNSLLGGIEYCNQIINGLKAKSKFFKYQLKDFNFATYELGENYCKIFTVITCYMLWIQNLNRISSYFDSGIWLVLALNNLFPQQIVSTDICKLLTSETFDYLSYLFSNNFSFSIVPISYP